jgi:hypothetical protein
MRRVKGHLYMSESSATGLSTGKRSRGRPPGSGGYATHDRSLFARIRAVLESTLQVATLRDAVRVFESELAGGGTTLSKLRRVERLFRAEVST